MFKIIISPAKKMNINSEIDINQLPYFLDKTERILKYMKGLSYSEAKALWKCNDKIAMKNYDFLAEIDLKGRLTPAIIAYEGIQYQYIAPKVFASEELEYIEAHLNIISGFYGILKPFDGVAPYRLEMEALASIDGYWDLYDFWGDHLYKKIYEDTDTVLNLASKEYSKCIENYTNGDQRFVTCIFGEYKEGKIITKGTLAKMARGEMVRYLAEEKIEDITEVKHFNRLDYKYLPEESDSQNLVFIKQNK